MIYALMILIGIVIGLVVAFTISKLIDSKNKKIDEEFLNLVGKITFEEEVKKKNWNKIWENNCNNWWKRI